MTITVTELLRRLNAENKRLQELEALYRNHSCNIALGSRLKTNLDICKNNIFQYNLILSQTFVKIDKSKINLN